MAGLIVVSIVIREDVFDRQVEFIQETSGSLSEGREPL
jgi:hypothetical protein